MVERIGDTGHADALAGIGEGLRSRNPQDIVVRIACHGSLERRLSGMGEVATEVHGEVGQVLEHEDIVLRGNVPDALQLFLGEADP